MRTHVVTIVVAVTVVVAALALAARFVWNGSRSAPAVLVAYGILAVLMLSFYGAYFGAAYFMSRYLSVLSPILALVGVAAVYRILMMARPNLRRLAVVPVVGAAVVLILGLNVRLYRNGMSQAHFQVVEWVGANVPPQTWVGAIQTGTLGYFHDRTVNLDGKVNPDALRARMHEHGVIPYVLRSKIMYLADWEGMSDWAQIERDGFQPKIQAYRRRQEC